MDINKSKQIIFILLPSRQCIVPQRYSVKLGRRNSHKSAFSSEVEMDLLLRQLPTPKTESITIHALCVSVCAYSLREFQTEISQMLEKQFSSVLTKEV